MVKSSPRVSFSVTSINYGTIDVGASTSTKAYNVYLPMRSNYMANAINMSVSFKEVLNASEARRESWVWVSTTLTATSVHIGSVSTGPEASIGSVAGGRSNAATQQSVHVRTNIVVPSTAATAGAVQFYLHHRYQYTGDDDD